jgi:hypothetical protein
MRLASPAIEYADYWDWFEEAARLGLTDGLPLAPPTEGRVHAILEHVGRDPGESVGVIPPQRGIATVEQVAIQCAMAGCLPEHAPVVIAAVEAMLDPAFNLHGVQTTSNPSSPLVVVTGPRARELGFNGAEGCFGGGSRANAAVGRAVRLILWNIGGGVSGITDLATLGTPAKYVFCIAEDHVASPWTPLHTDHGFAEEDDCVTVFACTSPDPIYAPGGADRILRILQASLPTPGVNMFHAAGQFMLAFSTRPARALAESGYSKDDVRRWIFDNARYDAGALRRADLLSGGESLSTYWGMANEAPAVEHLSDGDRLPMVHAPEDIHIVVAGGAAQWWLAFLAGWGDYGGGRSTTPKLSERRVLFHRNDKGSAGPSTHRDGGAP